MRKGTKKAPDVQGQSLFGGDPLACAIRGEIRAVIEHLLAEELAVELGAGPYARTEARAGYRHGVEQRKLMTSWGVAQFQRPRGRLETPQGIKEYESRLLPRYQRRSKEVDNEIMAMYLGGVSTRKIKRVMGTLGLTESLSAGAISRVIATLREHFQTWQSRCLKEEPIVYLYLDAIWIKTRLAGRVVSRAILVAVGVRQDGQKILLSLWSMGSESKEAWKEALEHLVQRGLAQPLLAVIDGCAGLRAAIAEVWPSIEVQRCAVHKLRNLLRHAPKHAHEDVREDFHAIVYAQDEKSARQAHERFMAKWRKLCASVAKSLQEAGEELFTFYRYPPSQWKSLRTTNVIERLQEEFRRRVKTQSSLPNEAAVLILLYGLVASGFIRMKKINGHRQLWRVIKEKPKAA